MISVPMRLPCFTLIATCLLFTSVQAQESSATPQATSEVAAATAPGTAAPTEAERPKGILPGATARVTREASRRPADLPSDAELAAAGARIGEIRIRPLDIFDTSIPEEDTALFRLANKLHIRTRESVIADQLLFESGQPYDGRLLQESARLLRDTRYLYDARIEPVALRDGVVDVEVVTNDVWTLNPGVSFGRKGGKNTSGFELEELNLLGLGTQIGVSRNQDIDRTSTLFKYRDRQLGRSWWSLALDYADNSDGKRKGIVLDRDFYALDTRWAAGSAFLDDERIDSRYDRGEVVDEYRVRQKAATVYGGWSRGLVGGEVLRWRAGYTYDDRQFDGVPGSKLPSDVPPDRKLAYPWVSAEWIQDDFRETRNRDQIERTEDFAYGWRARGRIGYASTGFGSDRDAVVFDGRVSRGFSWGRNNSLLMEASFDGRHEDGQFRDLLLEAEARYYRRHSERRLSFASLTVAVGHELDADRQVLLGGDNGLRGYPLRYQGGEGRWLLTLEQRFYSNWYPFRLVNVGGAVFADVGAAFGANPYGSEVRDTLADVGFGLRLGNSRSGLGNVLHLDVAFPLSADKSIKNVQFLVETKRSF
jgi:outer membrane protein assembly factor BamA